MKYSELHRKIIQAGWKFNHAAGSHYYYTEEGKSIGPVPYHCSKRDNQSLQRSMERVFKLCEKQNGKAYNPSKTIEWKKKTHHHC